MPKVKQTPGTVLTALLEQHDLNYNRLAKSIGLSSAMVRLIARDENPISAAVAARFAKFFKTTVEYWLVLQMEHEIAKSEKDGSLATALKTIVTVDKVRFERKPKTKTADKPAAKDKAAGGRRGRPKAAETEKDGAKKMGRPATKAAKPVKAPAGRRGRPAKAEAPKTAPSMKQPGAVKRGRRPAVKSDQVKSEDTMPAVVSETPINEPSI